ncbi:TPA: hypothetical protein ACPY6A_001736 [Yersinia enterocolitica]
MFALLIIPLIVSGYIVLTTHPYHFYRLHRYDGQLLYMKAAKYGVWCLVWSIILAFLIKLSLPKIHMVTFFSEQLNFSKDKHNDRVIGWLVLLSCSSIFIAWLWGFSSKILTTWRTQIINLIQGIEVDNDIASELVKLRMLQDLVSEGSMDKMFFDSLVDRKPVLITLKSKKLYVGIVSALGEPNEKDGPNTEISILPIMSGYRDKDTLRVIFTNDYNDFYDHDTTIVIPLNEISHTSWFTISIHDKVDNNCAK